MKRRDFLRSVGTAAAAVAVVPLALPAARVLTSPANSGWQGSYDALVLGPERLEKRAVTNIGPLSQADIKVWSRDMWEASRERSFMQRFSR